MYNCIRYIVQCTLYILEILKKRNHMNPSEIFEKHFTFCRNTEISQVSPLSPRTEGLLRGAQDWGDSWPIFKKVERNEKRVFLCISGAQHFVAHPLLCVHGDASLPGHLPHLRLGQQGVWQVDGIVLLVHWSSQLSTTGDSGNSQVNLTMRSDGISRDQQILCIAAMLKLVWSILQIGSQ